RRLARSHTPDHGATGTHGDGSETYNSSCRPAGAPVMNEPRTAALLSALIAVSLSICASSDPSSRADVLERLAKGERDFGSLEAPGVDLSEVDFQGSKLFGANLRGTNLARAKLRGCILDLAILRDATLVEADLSDASLFSSVFADA